MLLWEKFCYEFSQVASNQEIVANILSVLGKRAIACPLSSHSTGVWNIFMLKLTDSQAFYYRSDTAFYVAYILAWQEKARYIARNFSKLLALCSPAPCQRKIFKPDQLWDWLYSKSPEARTWWKHKGKGKAVKLAFHEIALTAETWIKHPTFFCGFNLKWLSHKKFMAGQELETLALEPWDRAVPIACPNTFPVSVCTNTNAPMSLSAEIKFLTYPKWYQALGGGKGNEPGKDFFCAHLFLVVSETVFLRIEKIVWNHIKRGLPSEQGQQRRYEQMPRSLERTGYFF